ncbi:MAG: tRNA (adenosine(37)-N6)-threonylcarbamoyltransferase complex transferase subunit TsaD, partial [Holophagales bacterium]|nr:tRNA (adenosine(37)-N6)-threonylcarbamoyltransferase complex transferase subunit TsaD [Holophagales bacterium]
LADRRRPRLPELLGAMVSNLDRPLILGIETSRADTACAVLDGAGRVLASSVSSQSEAHRPFGGVVPELAAREHLSRWPVVSAQVLEAAGMDMYDVDSVAATRGPGLVSCLLLGLSLGRSIAFALERPFHGIHHLEGYLYSPFLSARGKPAEEVPEHFLSLVISAGHTSLLEVAGGEIRGLVETHDDALGEVFDRVGKRLRLPYPQGPLVDELADKGTASNVMFRVPAVEDELFFSFSGLARQAGREIESLEARGALLPDTPVAELPDAVLDILASFRSAAVRQILERLRRVHDRRKIDTLAVSGGASANRLLRRELIRWAEEARVNLRLVPLRYAGDNAAMIAFASLVRQRRGVDDDPLDTLVASRIPFD